MLCKHANDIPLELTHAEHSCVGTHQDAAAEAEEQALLDRLEASSYEEVMSEYREYEKLKLGRTNECEGTSRTRPSNSQVLCLVFFHAVDLSFSTFPRS